VIGFGRIGSDSELIAMQAGGFSRWRIILPALLIGLIAAVGALQVNLNEAPRAQRELRSVVARAALYRLDSPVEPQTFTTDIPGYLIYVREGDKQRGQWGGVFIRSQEADGSVRLITARTGRIDSSSEKSELVLQDAVQTKLPPTESQNQQYVVERLTQLRILFNTGRSDLVTKLEQQDLKPDEMTFAELRNFLSSHAGRERREALLMLHKHLSLSLSPLVFAFFGGALALRLRRGSRGFGALISLAVMLVYYLLILGGDQMARAGTIPPVVGGWAATFLILAAGVLLFVSRRRFMFSFTPRSKEPIVSTPEEKKPRRTSVKRSLRLRFPTLLDTSVLRTMAFSFLFAFIALALLFDVFTTFELWRFVVAKGASTRLIAEYLFYLTPLISIEMFPGSILVAALLTYALIARRREAVAWWASGQSVYRLMLPGLAFALMVAAGSWFIQEKVMPAANVRQDDLRARIRGNIAQSASADRRWLVSADGLRIYSYDFDEQQTALGKPAIYEFNSSRSELKRVITGEDARWPAPNRLEVKQANWIDVDQAPVARESAAAMTIDGVEPPSVFKPTVDRPSQLDSQRLHDYIHTLKTRGVDTAVLAVGLQKKYASPFTVLIMALIGMPLAVSLGRKSTVIAMCAAVFVSLAFWLLSSGAQQLGEHGFLPPEVAAWSPIAIFAGGAFYFISRVRT
jgi:LPS export ABC transporter permease LptG